VLVCGPAGTGKTSLVAEWARQRAAETGTAGWITFEDGDSSFWGRLLECLDRLGLDVPRGGSDAVSETVLGRRQLTALAATIADRPERWTVVLDGYELASLELAREVDLLLRHTFGRLQLLFVGRVDPMLPLYRYRLGDSMLEIRAADLAFTDDEAARLLSGLGVTLSKESVHDLNERVKGWAAGLRFAARALAVRPDPEGSVSTVISQAGDINEYLLGEVLDVQTPEVRRFLLDTSVPDLLSPRLVEQLGGARALHVLDEVARANAFIEPVPDNPGSYRYYPFFRDLLRAQLAYEAPERVGELHRRAAAWYQREGLVERSIGHLAAVTAWDEVSTQIVDGLLVGRVLLEGPEGTLASVAAQVPDDLEQSSACVVRAAAALADRDWGACSEELSAARRTAATDSPNACVLLSVSVLDAVRASLFEDADRAAALAVEALRLLGGGRTRSRTASESELYALTQLSTGVVMLRRGDLKRARKALTIAVGLEPSRRFPSFRSDCLGYLAVVDALEGYLSRARRTALESSTTAADAGLPLASRAAAAEVALAFVAFEQYELKAAREHVSAAVAVRSLRGDPVPRSLLEGVMAGLERANGHLQPGLARLDAAADTAAAADPWLADWLHIEAAKLGVASGRTEVALRELELVGDRAKPEASVVEAAAYAERGQESTAEDLLARARDGQPRLPTLVSGLLVESVQQSRRRAPGRARAALDRSLRLAAGEELRRPFREAGPAVQRLLSADPRLLREHTWLSHSTAAPARSPSGYRVGAGREGRPPAGPEVVETLTAKELEVLGHLEELLTTEEIAEKMFVSVNTVRTHVRSILRKLGVSRRNAAVRKARELGLFDA
jgi:LuxR family maltose regulon positive regulatory protein